MTKGQRRTGRAKSTSGAKGGPSTSRGMNYQINLAILLTLEFIARALCAPLKAWEVRIEPRTSTSDGLTSWDVGFYPDDLWIETKLEPNRSDLVEWLGRVVIGSKGSASRKFDLVYHKGAGAHLEALSRLIRIAREASGNPAHFDSLISAEGVSKDDEFLAILGSQAQGLLSQMKLEQVPDYILEQDIRLRARLLAGVAGGERLRDFLFRKFHLAAAQRITFAVSEIISEARAQGIQFYPPPEVEADDMSPLARSSLVILQACSAGIPAQVIALALDCAEAEVTSGLEELQQANVVALDEGLWSMKPLETQISPPDSQTTLANALSSLLSYVEGADAKANLSSHVRNVIALAKKCTTSHPKLVAGVFAKLDKHLKRLGNKRQVWFVANLSIQAARMTPARDRDRDLVDDEARALICGTSWAFQRLNKLEKARVDAHQSLGLAQDAGLDRTLAYCLKCLGRLSRMEAEEMQPGAPKKAKLQESVGLLHEAIDKFSALQEFGSTHPEVGDCCSLLGRTFLELNQLSEAGDAVRNAYRLIVDESSKDYIDLVLLNGDLDVANDDRRAASSNYDRALEISSSTDPEVSEMRARAFLKRGTNEEALGQTVRAEQDYESAAQIWISLEDHESAANAIWKKLSLTVVLPEDTLTLLNQERATVRVETLREHLSRVKETAGRTTVARRSAPPREYWIQKIKEAKARLASRIPEL
jgi:tetratricopeptide (TPR) repeat protein